MDKLEERKDGKYITSTKPFSPSSVQKDSVEKAFDFAYGMTFGKKGEHRNGRSGGEYKRGLKEIFTDTFQGKLSEFALCNRIHRIFPDVKEPDTSTSGLGEWDSYDMEINEYKLSIKSTKSYGNLLLLETKDWDEKGQYVPNIERNGGIYDFFILIRMSPDCAKLLQGDSTSYDGEAGKKELKQKITAQQWEYDVPGWCSRADLVQAIKNGQIIKKGEMLKGKTRMDADNYYIQSGNLSPIEALFEKIKNSHP